ncbi:MAG: hypothetical protein ABSG61_15075 [Gemmatimonadales bacterium]
MRAPLPLCVLLLAALPARASAQQTDSAPSVIPASLKVPVWRRPWVRPLASLVVPGSGQLLGGRDRGMVYLAAEIWFVARALALSAQGRRERDQFITLGYEVARQPFTPYRLDAPWEYYEAMSHWVESGHYSLTTAAGPIQPETDTLTYNGAMWLLARRNFLTNPDSIPPPTDPAYQAALAFYRQRAFGEEFRWSWKDARLEMDAYAQKIRSSDNDFRFATTYLGALVLNHLASAVDAFITLRVAGGSILPRTGVSGSPPTYYLIWTRSF